MKDRQTKITASAGLAVGAVFGMAGTFAPSASMRGLLWGIDGIGLVLATALLSLYFFRKGQEFVAAGFLVFAIGEGVLLSGVGMDLNASSPSFGAGSSMWAAALVLISSSAVFPVVVRLLGFAAAALFAATSLQIFSGIVILPNSSPLPFYAYPVFVAAIFGWIWVLLKELLNFLVVFFENPGLSGGLLSARNFGIPPVRSVPPA
ncbi:MAG: hypothetical protein HQM13_13570 [SAR324 cluster bacterium]|nr:hypothetical protein [SAR324 cluster bacterium]